MIGRGTGLTVRGGKISYGLREDPEEKAKVDLRKDPPGEKKDPPTEKTDPTPTALELAIRNEGSKLQELLSESQKKEIWYLNPESPKYKEEFKDMSKDQVAANVNSRVLNLVTYARVNALQNPESTSFMKRLMDHPNSTGRDLSVDPAANDGLRADKPRVISPFELGQSLDFYTQGMFRDEGFRYTMEGLRSTEIPKALKKAREKDPKGLYIEGGIKINLPQHKGEDYTWPGSGQVYVGGTVSDSEFGRKQYSFIGLTQDDFPVTKMNLGAQDVNRDPITNRSYGFSKKHNGYYTVSQAEVDAFNAQLFAQMKMKNEFDTENYINAFGIGEDEILLPDGRLLLSSDQKQKLFAERNEAIRNR